MDYYQKYQKYRFKYLNLLNQSGGNVSITKLIENFNNFFGNIIREKNKKLEEIKKKINNELIVLNELKEKNNKELEELEVHTNNELEELEVNTNNKVKELNVLEKLNLDRRIWTLTNDLKYNKNNDKTIELTELNKKLIERNKKNIELRGLENLTQKLKELKANKAIQVYQTNKKIEALEAFKEMTNKELRELEELKENNKKDLEDFNSELKKFEVDVINKFDSELKKFTRDKIPKSTYDEKLKKYTYNYNQEITYEELKQLTDNNLLNLYENIVIYELNAVLKYLKIVDVIDTDIFEIILKHLDPSTRRNDKNKNHYFLIYKKAISHISRISYIKDTKYSSEDNLLNNFKIIRSHDMILLRDDEYKSQYDELIKLNKSNEIFVYIINSLITITPKLNEYQDRNAEISSFFEELEIILSYYYSFNIQELNFEQKYRIYQIAISHNNQSKYFLKNFLYIVKIHKFNPVLGWGGIDYGNKYLEFCELLFNNINNYKNDYYSVCETAVTKNGLALKYIVDMTLTEEQYLTVCEKAVIQNGCALEFVNKEKMDDTEYQQICDLAVKQNPDAQKYIK